LAFLASYALERAKTRIAVAQVVGDSVRRAQRLSVCLRQITFADLLANPGTARHTN
jgi:hypothetical protein